MTTKHLWEAEHPYYCASSNYYSNEQNYMESNSFADFLAEMGGADLDMNLVFRWDWFEGGECEGSAFNGDVNYRNGKLYIFYMGQRKGIYFYHIVDVCRADEPAVIAYLQPRADHLRKLWEPILPPSN